MSRRKQNKSRDQKRALKGAAIGGPVRPKSPLTQAWKGRMMSGVVRRGERQPGRSS